MHRLLTLSIIVAGFTQRAHAQLTPLSNLRAGDTVRVWAVSPRLNGNAGIFARSTRDTLSFTRFRLDPASVAAVPFPALRRLDLRRGEHRSASRIVISSLLGAAAGAFVGAFVGTTIECGSNCGDSGDLEGIAGFVIGAGTGIIAGGATGGLIAARHRSPRWLSVDLRR